MLFNFATVVLGSKLPRQLNNYQKQVLLFHLNLFSLFVNAYLWAVFLQRLQDALIGCFSNISLFSHSLFAQTYWTHSCHLFLLRLQPSDFALALGVRIEHHFTVESMRADCTEETAIVFLLSVSLLPTPQQPLSGQEPFRRW